MAKLCDINDCTSCMACLNACPFGAINIELSELSTRIPKIDLDKCKECGLCEKTCPIITLPSFNHPKEAIALYTKDKLDRETCSSGGLVTALSRRIIADGGTTFGATAIGGEPRFIGARKDEDLTLLKGSKYVYCDAGLIYREVKNELDEGRSCLFVGLPCNVSGLKQYLRKEYPNLLTVDLVCHGAPPYEYLKEHLREKGIDYHSIGNITFRGERDYYTTAYSKEGELLYSKSQYFDEYLSAFTRAVTFRPCCYECKFARLERVSDITAGDFWGLDKDALNGYGGKASVALLNTEKGVAAFEALKRHVVWEKRTVQEAVDGNPQLRHPSPITETSIKFHTVYAHTGSFSQAIKVSGIKAVIRKNKIRKIVLFVPKKILSLLRK